MPTTLDRNKVKQHLENFDLRSLFIQELGWDHGGADTEATVADRTFVLEVIANKRGLVAYPIFNKASEYTLIINTLQSQKRASGTTNALKPAIEGSQTIILRTPPGAGSMPKAS